MKKQTRFMLFVVALIAMLLLATVPAGARPPARTDYVATLYACAPGVPAREWWTDGGTVWHYRNMVYDTPIVSEEPRMTGIATWRGNLDLNMVTGDGKAWGSGTMETEAGTWQMVLEGGYAGWVGWSHVHAHGAHGLEGQAMFYDGSVLLEIPQPDPCGTAYAALMLTGYILEH